MKIFYSKKFHVLIIHGCTKKNYTKINGLNQPFYYAWRFYNQKFRHCCKLRAPGLQLGGSKPLGVAWQAESWNHLEPSGTQNGMTWRLDSVVPLCPHTTSGCGLGSSQHESWVLKQHFKRMHVESLCLEGGVWNAWPLLIRLQESHST